MLAKFSMRSSFRATRLSAATFASFAVVVLMTSPQVRADVYWSTSSGDWSQAGNWGGTLPTSSVTAYIVNGGTALVTHLGETCGALSLGSSAGSGTIQMTAGSQLTTRISGPSTGSEYVGDSGTGTFTQSGGTNNVSGGVYLGTNAGSSGTYNLNGGMLIVSGLGRGSGAAAFNFNGGTLQAGGAFSSTLPMTLATGGGATFSTSGFAVKLSGSLSGPGSLTKLGAGTLILTAANSYSGPTSVSAGTLQLGDGTAGYDGSLAGNIVDNAALVYNLNGSQSYSGTVSGSGSLTKAGAGTLTLTASHSYSGQTVISGGTLRLAGGSPILLADSLLSTTLNTANWTTNTSAPVYPAQVIPTTNGVELVSRGYLNTLAQYDPTQVGGLSITGNWKFTGSSGSDLIEIDTRSSGIPDGVYGEVTSGIEFWYYEGNATPTILSHGGNFSIGTVTTTGNLNVRIGDTLSFNATDNGLHNLSFLLTDLTTSTSASATAPLLSGTATSNFISFHNREAPDDLSTLSNVVISRLPVGNFLPAASPLMIATSATLDLGGASQQVASLSDYSPGNGGSVINSNAIAVSVLTLSPTSGSTTFSGSIQGGGALGTISLVMSGSGTQVLSGANTYTGSTIINSGVLNLGHPLAVQNSTVDVTSSGALSFAAGNTSPTLGGLAGPGNVALTTVASGAVTFNVGQNGQNTTYSGILSGAGGLTKQGAGILTLTASQSYRGPTIINGGTLRLRGAPPVPVGATAVYTFDNASGSTVPNTANRGTYDGTLQNGAAVTTFPGAPSGYALSLGAQGGNAFLQVAGAINNGIPTSTGTYTASSWFYGLYGPGYWRTLFRGSDVRGVTGDHPVILDTGSNNLGFFGNAAGGGFTGTGYSMASYNGATTWNQLTVVASGGTSTYYVDGQMIGTVPRVSTAGIFAIGDYQGGSQVFSQYLDNVYIYSGTALNAAGVMQLYNAASGQPTSNVLPTTTAISIAANATLDLGGGSQQVASLSDYSLGGGRIINSSTGSVSILTLSPSGGTTTFSGLIAGGGTNGAISLVKAGAGTQILAGADTYTGGTTVGGGVLQLGGQAGVPDNAALTVTAGTLDLGGFTMTTSAAISFQGGVVQNGVIVNNGPAFDGEAGTVSASLQGGAGLSKTTSGILTLTTNNTYSGLTAINSGALILAHPLAVQNSTVNVSSSGALRFAVGNTNPIFGGLAGPGNVALATVASEPVTLNVGQNGQNTTYSGVLSGVGGLTKQGAGILTLTASQSYRGPTVIHGGVLKLQPTASGSIGIHFQGNDSSIVTGSAGVVAMSNWNNLAGPNFTSAALTDNSGAPASASLSVYAAGTRSSASSNQLLNGYIYDDGYNRLSATIRGIPYANYSLYAYVADYNTNGTGEKLTVGVATYYYDATNSASYTQVTNTNSGKHPKGNYVVATGMTGNTQTVTVQGDTQQYGSFTGFEIVNTAVGGVNLLPIASSLTIGSGAALDLGGVSQQTAALSDYSPGNGGSVINSNAAAASVLTLSPTSGSTTFSGTIQGGGALGTISLVMSGSGTQVLAGSNTYTGPTTINQGELVVNGSLGSPVAVSSGGTLGGTGNLSSVTVNAGGTLAPGDSLGVLHLSGNLVLAASTAMDYELSTPSSAYDELEIAGLATLNGTLNVDLLGGFAPSAGESFDLISGATTGRFAKINLPSLGEGLSWNTSNFYTTGTISVVPEPSMFVLLGVGAIGLIAYLRLTPTFVLRGIRTNSLVG